MKHTNIMRTGDHIDVITGTIELNDVNVQVRIEPSYLWVWHSHTWSEVEDLQDNDCIELLDTFCKYWDRTDGVKYYQNFEGFKNLPMLTADCMTVIDEIDAVIAKYKFYPSRVGTAVVTPDYDDDSSWSYWKKHVDNAKHNMLLKEIYCDRYKGFMYMHDGNIYSFSYDDDNKPRLINNLTGEVHMVVDNYKNDEDVTVYEVTK